MTGDVPVRSKRAARGDLWRKSYAAFRRLLDSQTGWPNTPDAKEIERGLSWTGGLVYQSGRTPAHPNPVFPQGRHPILANKGLIARD